MLSYFGLRKGVKFILEGQPYEVLEFQPMRKAQDVTVSQTKIKNLITGKVFERNFHLGEKFEEAELEKCEIKFIYRHHRASKRSAGRDESGTFSEGGKFYFQETENYASRFELSEEQIGAGAKFLKPNQLLTGIKFQEEIINIVLPIKVHLKVAEAPPGEKGGRAQAGTKQVLLETGAKINTPLFIEQGDVVEVNTESGEYVRRVE